MWTTRATLPAKKQPTSGFLSKSLPDLPPGSMLVDRIGPSKPAQALGFGLAEWEDTRHAGCGTGSDLFTPLFKRIAIPRDSKKKGYLQGNGPGPRRRGLGELEKLEPKSSAERRHNTMIELSSWTEQTSNFALAREPTNMAFLLDPEKWWCASWFFLETLKKALSKNTNPCAGGCRFFFAARARWTRAAQARSAATLGLADALVGLPSSWKLWGRPDKL